MSVYNAARFLPDAVDSILAQDFTDFELLLLDDGSTDGSAQIVEDYARRDPRIRPIIRENRGLIVSLNQMLDEARADIVARMDADDIALPQRFTRQMQFLADNPQCGVVGTWCYDIDEDGNQMAYDPGHPVTHDDFLDNIRNGGPLLCHPSVMFRRDLVLAQGGYHQAFRHCEDLDLWLRLASVTQIANIPEPLLQYRHYSGQVSKRHATEQQVGAAIAYEAYKLREEGRPDPTAEMERLPAIDQLDKVFCKPGVARQVRRHVTDNILYSPVALRADGFDIVMQHVAEDASAPGLWRAVLRLLRLGAPGRAMRLATQLVTSRG